MLPNRPVYEPSRMFNLRAASRIVFTFLHVPFGCLSCEVICSKRTCLLVCLSPIEKSICPNSEQRHVGKHIYFTHILSVFLSIVFLQMSKKITDLTKIVRKMCRGCVISIIFFCALLSFS